MVSGAVSCFALNLQCMNWWLSPYCVCWRHHKLVQCPVIVVLLKARFHDPFLRIRFLVLKIGSRRSDGPISRFRFCGENVGRSFITIRFSELTKNLQFGAKTITGILCKICRRLFIFQEECQMKMEHVLFPSFFLKITDLCVGRSFSMYSHDPISQPTKFGSLKTDRVNGPLHG